MKMVSLLYSVRWVALFILLGGAGVGASGQDVKTYSVAKGVQYFQTSDEAPIPDGNNGVTFDAVVKASGSNFVLKAQIQLPNGSAADLAQDAADEFRSKKKYDDQISLDSHFPDGAYGFGLNTAQDGAKTLSLVLIGNLYPTVAPRLSNLAAAQAIDAGAYFIFTWDALADGNQDDFVQLHIDDAQGKKVWETPDLGELGALDGRATSALIPPQTLDAGQSYEVRLDFAKFAQRDTRSYPGAFGAAFYYRRTKFSIKTMATASQADLKIYWLMKSRRYEQSGPAAPTLQPSKAFNIDAEGDVRGSAVVSGATLLLPGGGSQPLESQSGGKSFAFGADSLTQAGLDAKYPNGAYSFQVATASGTKTMVVNLTGDAYPNAPHLTNWAGIVDPRADWLIAWEAFTGGTANDFIQVHVEDDQGEKIFETPDFGKNGALTGTALSATVPGHTLNDGKTYTARIVFQKNLVLDVASYPGALGVASYATRTTFQVSTGGNGPSAPRLTAASSPGNGSFQLVVQAQPGSTIVLQESADLQHWTELSTNTIPASGQATVSDPSAGSAGARFYRAVTVP